jgi:hypothetical protein
MADEIPSTVTVQVSVNGEQREVCLRTAANDHEIQGLTPHPPTPFF